MASPHVHFHPTQHRVLLTNRYVCDGHCHILPTQQIQVRDKMPCLSNKTGITSFSYPEFAYIICTRARGKSGLTLTRPSLTQQESSNPKPTDNTKGRPYSMGQPCANGWFGVENKAKCILTCTLRPCLERLVVP